MELIVGQSGTGKTSLLVQKFYEHTGRCVVFDFRGEYENILSFSPRTIDLLDFGDIEHPIPLNIFSDVPEIYHARIADNFVSVMKSVTGYDIHTPVLDRVLYNSARLVLDNDSSLLGLFYLLFKDKYRSSLVKHCTDPTIKDFWLQFDQLSVKDKRDFTSSTLSNIEPFITDMSLRNCIGQNDIVSFSNVLVISIPVSFFGVRKARLLALLLLSVLDHTVFVDDAELVMSPLLMERDNTVITLRSLAPLKEYIDRIDTITTLRTGVDDSKKLHKILGLGDQAIKPHELDLFRGYSLNGLIRTEIKIKPIDYPPKQNVDKIRNRFRNDFARPRDVVEEKLKRFMRGL